MLLAIDPGTTQSAWAVVRGDFSIAEMGKADNECVLSVVAVRAVPLAIEMLASYGMPVGAEVFQTAVWIGRFVQAHGGKVRYVYRKEVKMHLCGSMKAKDSNIRQALIDRFGPVGTKKNPGKLYGLKADLWSAYAVGVTALETHEDSLGEEKERGEVRG